MKGKQRCKILKQIRKQIADANGIEYAISECPHKGDCAGTCPKCESEVAYLERELEKRRTAGKKVALAGIAAATVITSAACRKEGFHPGDSNSNQFDGDLSVSDSLKTQTSEFGDLSGVMSDIDGALVPPPMLGTVDGIYSGKPHDDARSVPEIFDIVYGTPEGVKALLSGFRFDEVAAEWQPYVCDCFVENGAGYLYDGYSVHLYKNSEGFVDAVEVSAN